MGVVYTQLMRKPCPGTSCYIDSACRVYGGGFSALAKLPVLWDLRKTRKYKNKWETLKTRPCQTFYLFLFVFSDSFYLFLLLFYFLFLFLSISNWKQRRSLVFQSAACENRWWILNM